MILAVTLAAVALPYVLSTALWLVLAAVGRADRAKPAPNNALPSCIVVVPAFNEEDTVECKVRNSFRALAGVGEARVLVGSDGSTDATAGIVRGLQSEYGGRLLLREYSNRGKCATLNALVSEGQGEIVVSTDCDVTLEPGSISRLLRRFACDSRLGCVSSAVILGGNRPERLQWAVDRRVRAAESAIGMLPVVSGAAYAYRRSAFEPMPEGIMADDLWIPLGAVRKGFRCVLDREFRSSTSIHADERELRRKVRVIMGGIHCAWLFFSSSRSWRRPLLAVVFAAHKGLRWMSWLAASLVAIAACLQWPPFVAILGASVLAISALRRTRVMRPVWYGVLGLYAPLIAMIKLGRGADMARWQHDR